MKKFMYFESTEGGMETHTVFSNEQFPRIYGWMDTDCKAEDSKLLKWMESADVGESYEHRLGVLVRLKDAGFPDCDFCDNKGKVYELSQEMCCEHCKWQHSSWRKDLYEPKE